MWTGGKIGNTWKYVEMLGKTFAIITSNQQTKISPPFRYHPATSCVTLHCMADQPPIPFLLRILVVNYGERDMFWKYSSFYRYMKIYEYIMFSMKVRTSMWLFRKLPRHRSSQRHQILRPSKTANIRDSTIETGESSSPCWEDSKKNLYFPLDNAPNVCSEVWTCSWNVAPPCKQLGLAKPRQVEGTSCIAKTDEKNHP